MSTPNTHFGYNRIGEIMKNCRNKSVFFIGAGGIMMSSLALLTKSAGYETAGSDRTPSKLTKRLEDSGVTVFYSHDENNLGENCGAVVYTVAISEDNPEYARAIREGIPCISRADYLGYIMMAYKHRIGIAGMHGKSSCTSMCAEIFLSCHDKGELTDPTIISGAEYSSMGGAYHLGEHEEFIFEACEYMDSFLDFNPSIAVLLNAEMEHVDYFKSMDHICASFAQYASLVGEHGTVIYNADDVNTVCAASSVAANKISFGLSGGCTFRAVNLELDRLPIEFDILHNGEHFVHAVLPSRGIHSVYNALAAAAASYACGVSAEGIARGLAAFKGAKRRMEYKGRVNGAEVYDDYGHHPTEIAATLEGAKRTANGRLICVFQPHTYSRTAALADKFSEAFERADSVILADIYAAREDNIYGISSQKLEHMIGDKAQYGQSLEAIADILKSTARDGDTVIVMGAGDIFKLFALLGL